MSGVEVVATDFAGVLTEPLSDTYARFCALAGITIRELMQAGQEVSELAGLPGQAILDLGLWTEDEWATRLAEALARDTGVQLDLTSFAGRWWFPGRLRNEEFLGYLADLRTNGTRLAMVTNNVREWEPHWRAMIPEADRLFEAVVNSCEVGVRKPDRKIFELAADRFGVAAEACVLVDDLAENCEGARSAGWHAIHFTGAAQARTELDELLAGRGRP